MCQGSSSPETNDYLKLNLDSKLYVNDVDKIYVIDVSWYVALEFIETSIFKKRIDEQLSDEEQRQLLNELLIAPDKGSLIKGTSGLRKLRFGSEKLGKGKRGGLRIIYYWNGTSLILLLLSYGKNEADDLCTKMKKLLSNLVKEEF